MKNSIMVRILTHRLTIGIIGIVIGCFATYLVFVPKQPTTPVAKVKDVRPSQQNPQYGVVSIEKNCFINQRDGSYLPEGNYLFVNPQRVMVEANKTEADTITDLEPKLLYIDSIPIIYFKINPGILQEGLMSEYSKEKKN